MAGSAGARRWVQYMAQAYDPGFKPYATALDFQKKRIQPPRLDAARQDCGAQYQGRVVMHWNDWHMGWMWLGWILIIAVVVAVIWFAVTAARRSGDSRETPKQALKRRYANGEIDRDAYERMLKDLRK